MGESVTAVTAKSFPALLLLGVRGCAIVVFGMRILTSFLSVTQMFRLV
ncbi:hypothetical protein GRAN_3900 [Granulicella sibirica]|uniref:Uncharacterized protein n=1 Tax=Granulicella sibirica TaxID=2479048 RepID=A0A4Q0T098_9BACT|nr:hypothetical protein GRAN_3900 [Granulicella sibirica]